MTAATVFFFSIADISFIQGSEAQGKCINKGFFSVEMEKSWENADEKGRERKRERETLQKLIRRTFYQRFFSLLQEDK